MPSRLRCRPPVTTTPDTELALEQAHVDRAYRALAAMRDRAEHAADAQRRYFDDGEVADVFTADPEHLWRAVLARQPGELAKVAKVPENPRLN